MKQMNYTILGEGKWAAGRDTFFNLKKLGVGLNKYVQVFRQTKHYAVHGNVHFNYLV